MPASGVPAAASGPCRRRTGLTVYHLPRRQRGLGASQRCPSCRQWSLQAADRTDCISPPPTEGSGCQPAVSQLPSVVPAGGGDRRLRSDLAPGCWPLAARHWTPHPGRPVSARQRRVQGQDNTHPVPRGQILPVLIIFMMSHNARYPGRAISAISQRGPVFLK